MEKVAFKDAQRDQSSFLAPIEKKALLWLAARMPPWVNSDHLTLLGFLAMFGAGLCYWLASRNRWALLAVNGWLVVNWFGDSLDGTLARVRNRQRPRYGFYVDHITDAFGTLFLLGGLALSGYMNAALAIGLLIVYFMLSIEVYLATFALGTFHLSFWKFSPTELRLLLIVGNVALLFHPMARILDNHYRLYDVGGVIGLLGMGLMLIVISLRHTRDLYRAERLP